MSERRTLRINYNYLDKLFAALDRAGIDPKELPPSFIRMAWERKLEYLTTRYDVSCCARCKLPYKEYEMDIRYPFCKLCAKTLHRKVTRDPRVLSMLERHLGTEDTEPEIGHAAPSNGEAPTEQSAWDILERAARREPREGK